MVEETKKFFSCSRVVVFNNASTKKVVHVDCEKEVRRELEKEINDPSGRIVEEINTQHRVLPKGSHQVVQLSKEVKEGSESYKHHAMTAREISLGQHEIPATLSPSTSHVSHVNAFMFSSSNSGKIKNSIRKEKIENKTMFVTDYSKSHDVVYDGHKVVGKKRKIEDKMVIDDDTSRTEGGEKKN